MSPKSEPDYRALAERALDSALAQGGSLYSPAYTVVDVGGGMHAFVDSQWDYRSCSFARSSFEHAIYSRGGTIRAKATRDLGDVNAGGRVTSAIVAWLVDNIDEKAITSAAASFRLASGGLPKIARMTLVDPPRSAEGAT